MMKQVTASISKYFNAALLVFTYYMVALTWVVSDVLRQRAYSLHKILLEYHTYRYILMYVQSFYH